MVATKQLIVKLFFNLSNRSFYVQIGDDMLFMVRDTIVAAIQEKEQIEIRHVADVKEMQLLSLSDKKNNDEYPKLHNQNTHDRSF